MKEKVESSGWPCDDEDERQEYLKGYLEKEQIQLNPEKIQLNPGKRAVSKLMNNSLCMILFFRFKNIYFIGGKLAQNQNLSQVL